MKNKVNKNFADSLPTVESVSAMSESERHIEFERRLKNLHKKTKEVSEERQKRRVKHSGRKLFLPTSPYFTKEERQIIRGGLSNMLQEVVCILSKHYGVEWVFIGGRDGKGGRRLKKLCTYLKNDFIRGLVSDGKYDNRYEYYNGTILNIITTHHNNIDKKGIEYKGDLSTIFTSPLKHFDFNTVENILKRLEYTEKESKKNKREDSQWLG